MSSHAICSLLLASLLLLLLLTVSADESLTIVWLSVSPLANRTSQRNLEIHWRNARQSSNDDWVGLFSVDPIDRLFETAIESVRVDSRVNASHLTSVQFPYRFFAQNLTEQCLGYYVAYVKDNRVLVKNCIKTNPFWMEKSLPVIGERTLPEIMIPGTHNSGSYDKWTKNSWFNPLKRFYVTHDENIYNQLVYGIRYLDMRVGYFESEPNDKLWIVHDLVPTNVTLRSAAQQVKQFLTAANKEIVIFDFHRFVEGFRLNGETNETVLKTRFEAFYRVISDQLSELMIPFRLGYGVKINELIRTNKRVLIGFPADKVRYLSNVSGQLLWPNVRHQWAQTDRVDHLVQYFDSHLCRENRQILRSAMAELTPTRWGVLTLKYSSLRSLANRTNGHMYEWFADRWSQCANIVSVDFFLSSYIVDIAIGVNVNEKRLRTT